MPSMRSRSDNVADVQLHARQASANVGAGVVKVAEGSDGFWLRKNQWTIHMKK